MVAVIERLTKARKSHQCTVCKNIIEKKDLYYRNKVFEECSYPFSSKFCIECYDKISKTQECFYCYLLHEEGSCQGECTDVEY